MNATAIDSHFNTLGNSNPADLCEVLTGKQTLTQAEATDLIRRARDVFLTVDQQTADSLSEDSSNAAASDALIALRQGLYSTVPYWIAGLCRWANNQPSANQIYSGIAKFWTGDRAPGRDLLVEIFA